MIHLTGASASAIAGQVKAIILNVNTGFTGTITVQDGTQVVAVITNPTTGMSFKYGRFLTSVIVNPSTTCDLTVCIDGSNGSL